MSIHPIQSLPLPLKKGVDPSSPLHLNTTTPDLPFLTLQFTKPSNHDLETSSPGKFCHKPMHPKMEHFATSTQKRYKSCLKHHACTSHDAKWPVYSCMKTATCNKMANSYNGLKPNPKGVHSASHLNRIEYSKFMGANWLCSSSVPVILFDGPLPPHFRTPK
jgi:hypothetical protein